MELKALRGDATADECDTFARDAQAGEAVPVCRMCALKRETVCTEVGVQAVFSAGVADEICNGPDALFGASREGAGLMVSRRLTWAVCVGGRESDTDAASPVRVFRL